MKNICLFSPLFIYLLISSCIKNDIPYPKSVAEITAFAVEGQEGESVIDNTKRLVSVTLADTVDIEKVTLLQFEVSNNAVVEPEISKTLDMSRTLKYSLHTYPGQVYEWYIEARQNIDRYFIVEGQAEDAQIDANQKSVLVQMPLGVALDNLKVSDYKLGPANSVTTPDPKTVTDYTHTQTFSVRFGDKEEIWTVNAINVPSVELKVTTEPADAYAKKANLMASASRSGVKMNFKFKKASDSEWTDVSEGSVQSEGKSYSALVTGLEPETEYVYYAYTDEAKGSEVSFVTEDDAQLPNMGFDNWIKDGKVWYVNSTSDPSSEDYFWDTANAGANILSAIGGENNPTQPEQNILAVSGSDKKAVKMQTSSVVGVLAAGNVYSGQYIKTEGTNAIIDWGRPFTSRPTTLEGYYMYQPVIIDKARDPYKDKLGQMDECQIFVALMDMDTPYRVESGKKNYIDFDNDPSVIAYGELVTSKTMSDYEKFSIEIKYRDTRKPKYVILIACASYYGNYFTGGIGSTLFIDEFNFVY